MNIAEIDKLFEEKGWHVIISSNGLSANIKMKTQIFRIADYLKHRNKEWINLQKSAEKQGRMPEAFNRNKDSYQDLLDFEEILKSNGVDVNIQMAEFEKALIHNKPFITSHFITNPMKCPEGYYFDEIFEIETVNSRDNHHVVIASTKFNEEEIFETTYKEDIRVIRLNEYMVIQTLSKPIYDRQKTYALEERTIWMRANPEIMFQIKHVCENCKYINVENSKEFIKNNNM